MAQNHRAAVLKDCGLLKGTMKLKEILFISTDIYHIINYN